MSAQIIQMTIERRPPMPFSLSDQDCFSLAASMRILPGHWYAQRDEDDDGTVVMSLYSSEDAAIPAFLIRRDATGFRLESEDSPAPIGRYSNLRELLWAARRRLEHTQAQAAFT